MTELIRRTAEVAAALRDPAHIQAILSVGQPGMTWARLEEITGLGRYQLQRVLARAARAELLDHRDVPLSKAPGRWIMTVSSALNELAKGYSNGR